MTKHQLVPMVATAIVAWLILSGARHFGGGLLLGLGLLLLIPYWLGPVMVWLTNRSRVPRWDRPTSLGLEAVPASLRSHFEVTQRDFADLGFSLVSFLQENDLAPGYNTWVALHANRRAQEHAAAHAHVAGAAPLPAAPKPSIYFVTRWVDGRLVETANSAHVSPFPRVPGKESRQFPEVADPKVLYRIHQLRCAAHGSAPRAFPVEGDEVAYLARGMAEFFEIHVGTGYLRVVEPGRLFRPTAKGALLMTWRLLPPMTWIARWRRSQRNNTFLSEHHLLST
jgi:hypothetical protein